MTIALIAVVLWLAYSNGANDNFKGVATLYGSDTASFATARIWMTVTTLAGCALSVFLAASLAERFTGSGLVPIDTLHDSALMVSVGGAAAATIILATIVGMPTSTTHALTGALVAVSLIVNHGSLPLAQIWASFFLPLLVSPLFAVAGAAAFYFALRGLRKRLGITRESCACVGTVAHAAVSPAISSSIGSTIEQTKPPQLEVTIGDVDQCAQRYVGSVVGVDAQSAVDSAHFLSAGAVCFARAVNDTPKIAALLMVGSVVSGWRLLLVASAMILGGWLQSRRVAETISNGITPMNSGQGLTGNLVTAFLVIGASRLGLPVSTTHVSVGSILGIGVVGGRPQWKTVGQIAVTWLTTLPLGGVLGAILFLALRS